MPEDPDDQGIGKRILRILLYVDDYDRNETLSSLKQCSCGGNEDDGWQFTRQPQINVNYSTAVSYIRTRVRTFPANNTFFTSVGSETGLKKLIFFLPTFVVSRTRDPDPPVFRAVPLTFVVSRTRDPDPPVFKAVPLAFHLISHSLGNERS